MAAISIFYGDQYGTIWTKLLISKW